MSGYDVKQERDGIDARPVHWGAIVFGGGTAFGILACVLFLSDTPQPAATPPAPSAVDRTFVNTSENGITLKNEQRARLDHYGWADRDAGIARIPVERAMDLYAASPGAPSDAGTR